MCRNKAPPPPTPPPPPPPNLHSLADCHPWRAGQVMPLIPPPQHAGEFNSREPSREIEVHLERHRNEVAGETGDPRENPPIPTCENPVTRPGIEPGSPWWEASVLIAHPLVRYDSHMRKSRGDPTADRDRFAFVGGEKSNHFTTAAPLKFCIIWTALNIEVSRATMRGIEVSMEQRRNERAGETGYPREDSRMQRTEESSLQCLPDDAAVWWVFSGISRFCRPNLFTLSPILMDAADSKPCRHVGMQGLGKPEIPEKTRWPAASPGTIPRCKNPGATPPGIEPSSHCWEASSLTTTLPMRSGVVVTLLASRPGVNRVLLFPAGLPPGFLHLGIVPGDAAGRRVFSGMSPPPLHSSACPYSARFTLIGSQDLDCSLDREQPLHEIEGELTFTQRRLRRRPLACVLAGDKYPYASPPPL
ncbi:hypothetical protein PR048_031535 [Dryococelus australis]|uniref:Uncharacterized protein n=1 Tax=Dryococelus australis TaxID=614101 RepID=A0ABQ9G8D5_9NEOP|nr:hypothetical protein PR048_031535 [Dryococelus australis]